MPCILGHCLTTQFNTCPGRDSAPRQAWVGTQFYDMPWSGPSFITCMVGMHFFFTIYRTILLKAASHHIPTGRHRLHEEPVLAKILDVMTRGDDLHKRDTSSLELPSLNYDIQNRIYVHKRQKLRDFVET